MSRELIGICIDDEFTSFDMIGGDLISLGAVEVFSDFTLGREFQGFLRPSGTKYFSEKAEAIHGISYFKAQTFPEPKETLVKFLHWLAPLINDFPLKTIYWGSWNFDLKWIEATMEKTGLKSSHLKAFINEKEAHINVLKMARKNLKHIPVPRDLKKSTGKEQQKGMYKLSNVADFYDLEHNHHDALSDARVTAQIYCKLMNKEKTWTGELF